MEFFSAIVAIVTAKNFLVCLFAWSMAQAIKLVWHYRRTRRWYFHMLVGTGGMPSSHMTLVSCAATLIGVQNGWTSPAFQCLLVLALIVMSDAWGARRSAGRQAATLNRLVGDFYRRAKDRPKPLRELIGHTPLEVLAGACLGVLVAAAFT
jgi:hypothetical protein